MKPPSSPTMFSTHVESETLDAAWKGIGARRARARRVRQAWLATPIVAALALVLVFVFRRAAHETAAHQSAAHQTVAPPPSWITLAGGAPLPTTWSAAAPQVVLFDDGSRLELGQGARMRVKTVVTQSDPARVDLALEGGTTTFDIQPGGPRAWVIDAGETKVRVLGTRFTVARDGDHVHVSVARGKVRVESSRLRGGLQDLVAGQDVDVGPSAKGAPIAAPSAPVAPIAGPITTPVIRVENLPSALPPVSRPRVDDVRSTSIPETTQPVEAPAKVVATADRMADADAARKAGRPRDAVLILTSAVDAKGQDAALAAFTIGKIHTDELGDNAAAASWFERAIRLGLPIGLDEDAHARVVECHGRAGHVDEAARAASSYEAKFSSGRHLARVRRWKKE